MNGGWHNTLRVVAAVFLFVLPMPHTTSLRFASLFLLALIISAMVRRDELRALPLRLPFLAWTVVAFTSLTYAVNPWYSIGEIKAEILYSFLAFVSFYILSARGAMWWAALWTILASLVVLSLTSVFFWALTGTAESPRYFYNGVGAYTTYLVTVFPFIVLVMVAVDGHDAKKWLFSIVPVVFLIPAYLTKNRAFWIALIMAAVVLSALLLAKSKKRPQKIGVVVALAMLLSVSTVLFFHSLEQRAPSAHNAEQVVEKTIQADPRLALWHFVLGKIASHPERGVGFGQMSFRYAYPEWKQKAAFLFHAHNVFLNAGAQMGVPGILVMLWLFAAVLREYWRLYQSDERVVQWIAACGMAMVVAVVTKNMTDDFFRRDLALLFWALVGLSLGYGRYLANTRRAPP